MRLFGKEQYKLLKPSFHYAWWDEIFLLVPAQILLAKEDKIETVKMYENFYISNIDDGKAYITSFRYPNNTYIVEQKFIEKYAIKKNKHKKNSICILGNQIFNFCPESYMCTDKKHTESGFEKVIIPMAAFFKCCDIRYVNRYGIEVSYVVKKLVSMYPKYTKCEMEKAEEEVGEFINSIIRKGIMIYGFRNFGLKSAEELMDERNGIKKIQNATNEQLSKDYENFMKEVEMRKSLFL